MKFFKQPAVVGTATSALLAGAEATVGAVVKVENLPLAVWGVKELEAKGVPTGWAWTIVVGVGAVAAGAAGLVAGLTARACARKHYQEVVNTEPTVVVKDSTETETTPFAGAGALPPPGRGLMPGDGV